MRTDTDIPTRGKGLGSMNPPNTPHPPTQSRPGSPISRGLICYSLFAPLCVSIISCDVTVRLFLALSLNAAFLPDAHFTESRHCERSSVLQAAAGETLGAWAAAPKTYQLFTDCFPPVQD